MTPAQASLILQAAAAAAWCIIAYCVFQIALSLRAPRLAPAAIATQRQTVQRPSGNIDVVRVDIAPGMKRTIDRLLAQGYQLKRIDGLIIAVK